MKGGLALAMAALMGAHHSPPATLEASNPDRRRPTHYKPRTSNGYGIPFPSFVERLSRRAERTKDLAARSEMRRARRARKQRRGW